MRKQIKRYGGGAAAAVFLDGKPVVDIWAGPGRKDGTPWQQDTMSICYSGTKGITSTALHMLATDGLIDYEAPVAEYWPEFGCNGKEQITVDLKGVTRADSAGLALLVEWLRESENAGNSIEFVNVPTQLLSIARVCGLEEILSLN